MCDPAEKTRRKTEFTGTVKCNVVKKNSNNLKVS